jgi:uncharacterized protein RhaS with RHS repeats
MMAIIEKVGRARYYDGGIIRCLTPDPLADKYYGWSPYNYVLGNPLRYIDPDGKEVWVRRNDDSTYTVIGGILNDDREIYIRNDEGENVEMIGLSLTTHSVFDDDGNPVKGAVIDMNSNEGQEFLDKLINDNPFLPDFIPNARSNRYYDFKARGVTKGIDPGDITRHHYRGSVAHGGLIGSARDFGNIGAGIVAGRQGLNWAQFRFGADGYQMIKNIRSGSIPWIESRTTRLAQRTGYEIGVRLR